MKRLIVCLTLLIFLSSSVVFGATYYITPTGNGLRDGSSWANALDSTQADAQVSGAAGCLSGATPQADTWFFLAGDTTYTVNAQWGDGVADATDGQPIMVVGVTPMVVNPWPNYVCSGASRPFIQLGANKILVDNYWQFRGLMIEGTADQMVDPDQGTIISGCSVFNVDSTNANREAIFHNSSYMEVYNSEVASSLGDAIVASGVARVMFCDIHTSKTGVNAIGQGDVIMFNTFWDDVSQNMIGVNQDQDFALVMNNTFYQLGEGINSDADDSSWFLNNIFELCAIAIDSEKDSYSRTIDYNNYLHNTTDINGGSGNSQKGPNATAHDPNFTDPTGDPVDFSPDAGSGVTSAAKAMKVTYSDGSED